MKPSASRATAAAACRVAALLKTAMGSISKTYHRHTFVMRGGTDDLSRVNSETAGKFPPMKKETATKLRWASGGSLGTIAALHLVDSVSGSDEPGPQEEIGPEVESGPQEEIGPEVESGIDATVQRYADMSPFLREQLEKLQAEGWTIGYGEIDALGKTFYDAKKIIIDNDMKKDPLWATAVLAHEVGHAYPGRSVAITDPPTPGELYSDWLGRNMRMRYLAEAESGLVTARVRQEILDRGGPDIGNISKETIDFYGKERAGELSHIESRNRLANMLSFEPYDHYRSELEKHWDENYVDSHGPSVVEPMR